MSRLPADKLNVPLWNLVIPGSHDSMSYDLDINSSIIEPDRLKKYSHLHCARSLVRKWARTQVMFTNIIEQLNAGARYFDLRIARKQNDPDPTRLYFYHGLLTCTDVETVLWSIKEWAEQHPKEIIILALSHFKGFGSNAPQLHEHLTTFIQNLFSSRLVPKPIRKEDTPTLQKCWNQNQNVIVSYDYSEATKQPVFWFKIIYFYGDCMDPSKVEELLAKDLKFATQVYFYVCGLNLTLPENTGAVSYVVRWKSMASFIRHSLSELLTWTQAQAAKTPLNIVASDLPCLRLSPTHTAVCVHRCPVFPRSSVVFRMASGSEESSSHKHTNRLSQERSPYLLQHAHNPVDWYPWGQEAFDKAKAENKPIFLSVGYSTCLHDVRAGDQRRRRMAHECVADSGAEALHRRTYFPPRDHARRPGLKTVLGRILEQWQKNRPALESSGDRILAALRQGTAVSAEPGANVPLAPDVAQRCFQQLAQSYEEEYGGFRDAPKFPSPVNLMFLLSFWCEKRSSSEGAESLQMALHTLRMMALGGIHDHIAQGFHRYSTDSSWHVPHFEKMLYDQAQLAVAYITASQVSGEPFYADVARDILQYVSRDLSDKPTSHACKDGFLNSRVRHSFKKMDAKTQIRCPSGGFYSAEDADSVPVSGGPEKREGAFCVWTASEVRELLSEVVEGATGSPRWQTSSCTTTGSRSRGMWLQNRTPTASCAGRMC
ncbi:hypothetical protein WMY93_009844 [Mugilogobius chulae]|uniref:Phosphatidylinositol-specific phospholipase C X domain-containing protein n=1 Tax=Mugilogobius chulae TaxID=88201 RepID=A0AAW0P645_9GOBI